MFIPTSALPAYTVVHVIISLAAILSGFVVTFGMITSKQLDRWTAIFLATTVLTSVTGFGFPIRGMTPGIAIGIISLAILAPVLYARYSRHLDGRWRDVYTIGAIVAFYLNFIVLIVQSFQKIPTLHTLAPNQNEPPFLVVQVASMIAFIVLGYLAVRGSRGQTIGAIPLR